MSDTEQTVQILFDGTADDAAAECGCRLCRAGARDNLPVTSVLLCPLHASAADLFAACEGLVFEAEQSPGPPHSHLRLQAARDAIAKAQKVNP